MRIIYLLYSLSVSLSLSLFLSLSLVRLGIENTVT